ncbi:MAG: autotransporter domain-containing protein [Bradyrhizobium sp.]|uniref:autotransporter outer membrane beta-barrel domain-containing protein n=1 Tax=Bradyrhizobium sp. TaxID=376 RepID=UPI001C28C5B1|nr:autotransporter domain-containing protein [Bradyrhizobium sp.]MBU6464425.1 autotransporter domain-containing protein [Pseudomonadota bacterium]MDE2069113.1 autotransporter domain-containing protein [Bradyrhizobium sp.]
MYLKRACFAGAALLCSAHLAEAQNFNQLIGFGDSTVDTGWYTGASSGLHSTGVASVDASIAASLAAGGNAHPTGPGLGNAQILAGFFGLSVNSASQPGGTNFAVGNAVDYLVPPGYVPVTSTGNQYPNPLLPGTATQINNYVASVNGNANPNAIYLLASGGNDASAALSTFGPSSPAAVAYLLGEAQALTNSLVNLQAAGARYIIMSNYYPGPSDDPARTAYAKTIVSATWSDLATAGVRFIPADTVSVFAAVERNPVAFGITHDPLATGPSNYACLPAIGSGLTSGYGVTCAPTTAPSTTHGYLQSADATQTYLFMDGVHLTEAGQQIEADYFYNLLLAPSEISYLAETAVQTTFQTITGIQQQIDLAQRLRRPGWNVWVNGQLSYLKLDNSSTGFPSDPGFPLFGSMGVDYKWENGWLAGAALTAGYVNPTFSLGGGYKQDSVALSLYTAYRNTNWWADLTGTAAWLGYDTNRTVPIGITVQANDGSTDGADLSLAAEIGYDFHAGAMTHGPVAGLILQQARVNGFTEGGSFTSLSFGDQVRNSEVGVLGYQVRFDCGKWHPFAQLAWDHEFDPLDRMVTASLTTIAAPSYSLPAVVLGRDWGTATVGTQLTLTSAWSGLASFTAQLGQNHATALGGLVGFDYALGQMPTPLVYQN